MAVVITHKFTVQEKGFFLSQIKGCGLYLHPSSFIRLSSLFCNEQRRKWSCQEEEETCPVETLASFPFIAVCVNLKPDIRYVFKENCWSWFVCALWVLCMRITRCASSRECCQFLWTLWSRILMYLSNDEVCCIVEFCVNVIAKTY